MARRKVVVEAVGLAGLAEPSGKVPVEEMNGPNPIPKRRRRTKAEIAIEKEARALMAPAATGGSAVTFTIPVNAGPAPSLSFGPVTTEPADLLPYDDVALVAELEGVPLLSYINQALQGTEQSKRIKENLDNLRKAIDEFLVRAGAPGFVFVDTLGEQARVYSFRRVTTKRTTLDEVLLLENGVPVEVLEKCKRKSITTALTIREIKG